MRRSTWSHGQQSYLLATKYTAQTLCQCWASLWQRKRKSLPSNTENSLTKKPHFDAGKSKPSGSPSYVQSSYHKRSYDDRRAKIHFTLYYERQALYMWAIEDSSIIVQLFNSAKYNGTTALQWYLKSRCSGFTNPRWAAVGQNILGDWDTLSIRHTEPRL